MIDEPTDTAAPFSVARGRKRTRRRVRVFSGTESLPAAWPLRGSKLVLGRSPARGVSSPDAKERPSRDRLVEVLRAHGGNVAVAGIDPGAYREGA